MANTRSNSLGPGLSTAEQVAGFCYLPFHLFLLSFCIQWIADLLGFPLNDLQLNVALFTLDCIFVWIIFHNFLLRSFRAIRFWELVQAVILGGCMYYAGKLALGWLSDVLHIPIPNFNDETVIGLISQNKWVMGICSVVLAPIVEETLVRGLVFGVIRRKSRIMAYVVSVVLFSFMHVWIYLTTNDIGPVLLSAVQYLPAGIALGWTYEKSNTIWAPITLHMIINAISMGVISIL